MTYASHTNHVSIPVRTAGGMERFWAPLKKVVAKPLAKRPTPLNAPNTKLRHMSWMLLSLNAGGCDALKAKHKGDSPNVLVSRRETSAFGFKKLRGQFMLWGEPKRTPCFMQDFSTTAELAKPLRLLRVPLLLCLMHVFVPKILSMQQGATWTYLSQ